MEDLLVYAAGRWPSPCTLPGALISRRSPIYFHLGHSWLYCRMLPVRLSRLGIALPIMWVPTYSLRAIRILWTAIVLWLEIGIFVAAGARCRWPDPGVCYLSPHPFVVLVSLTNRPTRSIREMERQLTSSSSPIRRFSMTGRTRSAARSSGPCPGSSST